MASFLNVVTLSSHGIPGAPLVLTGKSSCCTEMGASAVKEQWNNITWMDLWRSSGPNPCSEQAKSRLLRSTLAVEFRFYLDVASMKCNSQFFLAQRCHIPSSVSKWKATFKKAHILSLQIFQLSLSLSEVRSEESVSHKISQISQCSFYGKNTFLSVSRWQQSVNFEQLSLLGQIIVHNPFLLCVTACHNSKQD